MPAAADASPEDKDKAGPIDAAAADGPEAMDADASAPSEVPGRLVLISAVCRMCVSVHARGCIENSVSKMVSCLVQAKRQDSAAAGAVVDAAVALVTVRHTLLATSASAPASAWSSLSAECKG